MEHEQRSSLGQRLVLAAQLALELLDALRLSRASALGRLQAGEHRVAPRIEVGLVQPLAAQERPELRVREPGRLEHQP